MRLLPERTIRRACKLLWTRLVGMSRARAIQINAVLNALSQTYHCRDLFSMPMSTLGFFGPQARFRLGKGSASIFPNLESAVHLGRTTSGLPRAKGTTASLTELIPRVMPSETTLAAVGETRNKTKTLTDCLPLVRCNWQKMLPGTSATPMAVYRLLFAMSRTFMGTSCTSKGTNNACFLLTIP